MNVAIINIDLFLTSPPLLALKCVSLGLAQVSSARKGSALDFLKIALFTAIALQ